MQGQQQSYWTSRKKTAVPADPTRRAILAASAALPLLVAGCKGVAALGPPPKPSDEVLMLRAAIAAEAAMVARYQAAISLHGQDQSGSHGPGHVLAIVLGQHQQHLTQLRGRLTGPHVQTTKAVDAARSQLTGSTQASAFTLLEHAEQAASNWLLSQLSACSPSLAQLVASICAAEAAHVPYLRAAGQS
jgi:hypothetical protein